MTYQKQLKEIAFPVMIENALQGVMTLVDTYFVSRLGLAVVSGVALAGNVLALYQAVFIAIGAVVSAAIAKAGVQDNKASLQSTSQAVLVLILLISLVFGFVSVLMGTDILSLLGASLNVSHQGGLYLAWVGGGNVFLALIICLSAMLRAQGQTRWSMWVSLVVSGFNLILSALAVYGLDLGVRGVALATLLSRLVGVVLLWWRLPTRPVLMQFGLDAFLFKQVFSAASERLMMRLGDIVVISLVVKLGTKVVAGHAIGETLTQFNYLPAMSVATATVILSAQAHSQDDYRRLEAIRKDSYWLALRLTAVVSGLMLLTSPWSIRLYALESQVFLAAHQVMWMSFLGCPIVSGTLVMTSLWQGVGQAKLPFWATSFGMWGIRIGLGYVLVVICHLGLVGVLIATVSDNTFRFLYLLYRYVYTYRSLFSVQKK